MFLFFEESLLEDIPKLGRKRSGAVLVAGIIDNYYTGLETMFFRISQFFENSLSRDRWHSDLLHRMRISIKDERVEVISDKTFSNLDEIRRFRHFNRYYYNSDYDWDRIDFLIKKMHGVNLVE
jgi:Uri superfamily endonuclease